MSIDLEGWYIKTNKNVNNLDKAEYYLEVIGANHDWGYKAIGYHDDQGNFVATTVCHDGSGPQWYSADKER